MVDTSLVVLGEGKFCDSVIRSQSLSEPVFLG